MVETTMRFVVEFRDKAVKDAGESAFEAMSLGELLYWVLVGERRADGLLEA